MRSLMVDLSPQQREVLLASLKITNIFIIFIWLFSIIIIVMISYAFSSGDIARPTRVFQACLSCAFFVDF